MCTGRRLKVVGGQRSTPKHSEPSEQIFPCSTGRAASEDRLSGFEPAKEYRECWEIVAIMNHQEKMFRKLMQKTGQQMSDWNNEKLLNDQLKAKNDIEQSCLSRSKSI